MNVTSRTIVCVCLSAAAIATAGGCKERAPYPGIGANTPAVTTDGVQPDAAMVNEGPSRALALVRTARGTTVVSGHDSGASLVVSEIPGYVHAMPDGSVRVVRVKSRAPDSNTPRKRSSLAGLFMEEYGPDGALLRTVDLTPERTASWVETSEIIKEAIDADPDMAAEFYHTEKIENIGSSGHLSAWLVSEDSFLGGAHPSNTRKLLLVDAAEGRVVDGPAGFAGRDVVKEILKDRYEAACMRDNGGMAAMEGPGGQPVWVVLLAASFGACEGQTDMQKVDPPAGTTEAASAILEGQVLTIPDIGIVERGVADFRVASKNSMAVVEMALGVQDEVHYPWMQSRGRVGERSRTREARFWVPGMHQAAVIGRLPEIHSVEFLPQGKASIDVLAAIRGFAR